MKTRYPKEALLFEFGPGDTVVEAVDTYWNVLQNRQTISFRYIDDDHTDGHWSYRPDYFRPLTPTARDFLSIAKDSKNE